MNTMVFLILVAGLGSLWGNPELPESPSQVDEIVWLGLDYSQVRFIGGQDAFSDLSEIRSHYFRSWNELIMMESEKYNVASAFRAGEVRYEIETAIARSEARDMEGILQTSSHTIDESLVREMVADYVDPDFPLPGALMVMETLDKLREQSTMWLVVFDISTGEVLYLKWYTGKAGGFGFRNYWARCYYNVLKGLKVSPRKPLG